MSKSIETHFKTKKPEFIKSDIKLTIGILVSNHIKYIRKGMEAIKPLLDAVPSELIVVDTVGPENSDGSLDVVREYTDKIYHFDWIDDFSAARNVAIDHARGEWFMYFDDDEYFDDVTEFIDFFKSGECEKYNIAYYYTGDYTKKDFFQKAMAERMVRRTNNTRFVGIVHERFNETYLPIKQFKAFTHHFGYLYETPEQKDAKTKRNLPLLEKELSIRGLNTHVCAQIIQEMMAIDQEEASKRCTEFVNELEKSVSMEDVCGQWLLLAKVRFMALWQSLDGILDIEKYLQGKYRLNETSRLILAQQVACVAFSNKDYRVTADRVKTYFDMLDWLEKHDNERIMQSTADFPAFMIERVLFNMVRIGLISENRLGNFERAYSYIERLDLNYCVNSNEIRVETEKTLSGLGSPILLIEYYQHSYKGEFFSDKKLYKFLPNNVRDKIEQINAGTKPLL